MSMCRRKQSATSASSGLRSVRPLQCAAQLIGGRHGWRQARSRAPAGRGEAARIPRLLPMTMPKPRSSCWPPRQQKRCRDYFTVEQFNVTVESQHAAANSCVSKSAATVELMVAGEKITNSGGGNGPVNALDDALRKDLGKYSPFWTTCDWWITRCVSSPAAPRPSPA